MRQRGLQYNIDIECVREKKRKRERKENICKGLFEQENVAKKERKSERERVRERKQMRKASSMSNKEKETL